MMSQVCLGGKSGIVSGIRSGQAHVDFPLGRRVLSGEVRMGRSELGDEQNNPPEDIVNTRCCRFLSNHECQ